MTDRATLAERFRKAAAAWKGSWLTTVDVHAEVRDLPVIADALAHPAPRSARDAKMLPCPVCGGEAIHAIETLRRTVIHPSGDVRATVIDALTKAREEIVLTIAFLGRDAGTERIEGTIKRLVERLSKADAAILGVINAGNRA